MIKLNMVMYRTELNAYGNRHYVCQATSVKTGQSFLFKTHSEVDTISRVKDLLKLKSGEIWLIRETTGSSSVYSLPEANTLTRWEVAEEFQRIGFFVTKSRVEE